jgi:hypothetical protein
MLNEQQIFHYYLTFICFHVGRDVTDIPNHSSLQLSESVHANLRGSLSSNTLSHHYIEVNCCSVVSLSYCSSR